MSPSPIHPGQVLRDLLDERRISQIRAAEALGMTRQHLNSIINGHNPISADLKLKLQDYLGVAPSHWSQLQDQQDQFASTAEGRRELLREKQSDLIQQLDLAQRVHLVDHEIDQAVRSGWLSIDPFDPTLLSPSGFWLTLGLRGTVHSRRDPSHRPAEKEVVLKPEFDLEPGMVLTVLSHERIELPDQLAAQVATEADVFCGADLTLKCRRHFDTGLKSRIAFQIVNESGRTQNVRHRLQAVLLRFEFQPVSPARCAGD